MSKGAKQAIFIALAALVAVAAFYTVNSNKSTGAAPAGQVGGQTEEIDPAILARIQTLESTLKTTPQDLNVLSELGELYFQVGQLDKAQSTFTTAIQVDPNNSLFYTYLGLAYFWTGKATEAMTSYKKAIELSPGEPEAYFYLALAQSHSTPADVPAAVVNWKKVIELVPDSPIAAKSQEYIDKSESGARESTAPSNIKP